MCCVLKVKKSSQEDGLNDVAQGPAKATCNNLEHVECTFPKIEDEFCLCRVDLTVSWTSARITISSATAEVPFGVQAPLVGNRPLLKCLWGSKKCFTVVKDLMAEHEYTSYLPGRVQRWSEEPGCRGRRWHTWLLRGSSGDCSTDPASCDA